MNRKRLTRILLGALLLAGSSSLLPGDAQADVACCLRGTSTAVNNLNALTSEPDERFFMAKGTPPNLMFLLDTSCSMNELVVSPRNTRPRDPSNPGRIHSSFTGCWDGATAALKTGYDDELAAKNFSVSGNHPPIDLGVAPAEWNGDNGFPDLFKQAEYYRYRSWEADPSTAPGYSTVASACAGVAGWCKVRTYDATDGRWECTDWQTDGKWCQAWTCTSGNCSTPSAGAVRTCSTIINADRVADCNSCLTNKGYFLDPGTSDYQYPSTDNNRLLFSGRFLNVITPKFHTARTVLKKVLWRTKSLRMGLTVFDENDDGGKLISAFNPPCNQLDDPTAASWDSNRKSLINELNNKNKVYFKSGTPLAEALLNVGQYFGPDNNTMFDGWFGTGWTKTEFQSKSGNNVTLCRSCQINSTVVVTDGAPWEDNCTPECVNRQDPQCTLSDGGVCPSGNQCGGSGVGQCSCTCDASTKICQWNKANPCGNFEQDFVKNAAEMNCTGSTNCQNDDCEAFDCQNPVCPGAGSCPQKCGSGADCKNAGSNDCCDQPTSPQNDRLDGVAKWFFEKDLDGNTANGKQRLLTYTVGFGIDHPLLAKTADVGGGAYFTANDRDSLAAALLDVIEDVARRATTFGTTALSTVQSTSAGTDAFVPRFQPGLSKDLWRGYLYRFDIESEFTNGCQTTTAAPRHAKDLDEDGLCETFFYKDADGAVVEEDPETGLFVKKGTTTPANPIWEAGDVLTNTTGPDGRNIWTVTDSNTDDKLDASDTMREFSTANAATLAPYMGISDDVTDDTVCGPLYDKLGITSPAKTSWGTDCAKVIIEYYRGKRSNDPDPSFRTKKRSWIFQDVFHSSPVVLEPPRQEASCDSRQCLKSLFTFEGKRVHSVASAAYKDFVTAANGPCGAAKCEGRHRLVLIGSNGGFLHAFDSGAAKSPETRNALTGNLEYENGEGKEVWAFIPPDLLPALKHNFDRHAYFVDGTPMVREVWVDTDTDGVKESGEYRTMVVTGERRGGQHFFALDVTRSTDDFTAPAKPKPSFRWMWPQPCDTDVGTVGETWSNFFPKPPPIGPVLLEKTGGFTFNYRTYSAGSWSNASKAVEERWVAMLNGGYDRAMVRGRGFGMLDVWTGAELWREFFAEGNAMTNKLAYPIASGMAMLDIGPGEMGNSTFFDGYFDTATFGDMGSNLWTARFYEPGALTSGKVTNWRFARAFQSEKGAGATETNRRPISYITSNTLQLTTGMVRTFFGTGDRAAVLHRNGGECSFDSLSTCIQMGCEIEAKYESKNVPSGEIKFESEWDDGSIEELEYKNKPCVDGACKKTWEDGCEDKCTDTMCNGQAPCPACAGEDACEDALYLAPPPLGCLAACPGSCTNSKLKLKIKVKDCPSGSTVGPSELKLEAKYECKVDNGKLECKTEKENFTTGVIEYKNSALGSVAKHKFYQVHTFGRQHQVGAAPLPLKIFNDTASANVYDSRRLTETNLADLGTESTPSGTYGTDLGAGWFLTYDSIDERTAAPSAVAPSVSLTSACVLWDTMRGAASDGGQCPVPGGEHPARQVQAEVITGKADCAGFMMLLDGGFNRYIERTTLVTPPTMEVVRSVVNGKVVYTPVGTGPGSNPKGGGTATETDMVQSVYQLELSPAEHRCRHVSGASAACGK
ncbi:MAG: hypothetical protein HYZ28_23825 [Myxococcales bacterium]|nr:hypothetical protein [Myxococcales bacterium]